MVAPWVMLNAPRQLLQSGVRAVETMTASGMALTLSAFGAFSVHCPTESHGCARRHRRARFVARPRRAVRLDDARRLWGGDHQDRAARRRDLALVGPAVLWRRGRVLRQPESQQEERRDRSE